MTRDPLPAPAPMPPSTRETAMAAAMAAAAPALPDPQWQALLDAAAEPYRPAGRFAWHFARGKLGRDPVFRGLLERGDLVFADGRAVRLVDIGCGQALLPHLLDACGAAAGAGASALLPRAASYHGIELMPADVERAQAALGARRVGAAGAFPAEVRCADMREAALPEADAVVILDVMHYVDHAAQEAVLGRVRDALAAARGRLLLRVGDRADARGFAWSQRVDRLVTRFRGHRVSPTWGRTVHEWVTLLHRLGFARIARVPMSQGTPFANVLLVADLDGGIA